MKRIVLLTSNHQRHRWLAAQLAEVAELVCVATEEKPPHGQIKFASESEEIRNYFRDRDEREAHWFQDAPHSLSQIATQVRELPWQGANTHEMFEFLQNSKADQIFLFGSSIIRDPILSHFHGRIVNMHLGLSPYYRGSATNYWPLVDNLPECVGVTVHHATAVVDGGGILAQARPDIHTKDSVHDIGCKTIIAGAKLLKQVTLLQLPLPSGAPQTGHGKLCRRADFGIDSLRALKCNMGNGMLQYYLANKSSRDALFPIVNVLHTYS